MLERGKVSFGGLEEGSREETLHAEVTVVRGPASEQTAQALNYGVNSPRHLSLCSLF